MKEHPVGILPDGSMDTFSGEHVHILHPDPDSINIRDIAHHLSLICRYNGACKWHYSVAQHSILTVRLVEMMGGSRITKLGALMHDAPEAYTGDFIRPIKYMEGMEALKNADTALFRVIAQKFNLGGADWKMIREADNIIGATEARQIMNSKGRDWKDMPEPANIAIARIDPGLTEVAFIAEYEILSED